MGSEWSIAPLEEIAEVLDSRHKTPQYADEGLPMVRVVDIKGGCLSLDETKKVSVVDYNDYSKGRDPQIGDLLISRVGSYGNIAYVDNVEKFCLGQNTALIIPKIHWRYLYYQLISPFTKAQIEQMVVGAVQKTISLKTIRALEIPLPPLPEQKAIAHILGTLDDKIELNRRMNATLEGMAQALFKSWFVDFDPVIDNALTAGNPIPDQLAPRAEVRRQALANGTANREAAKPFPAAFQETESMDWIPAGWEVESIYRLISVFYGAPFKSSMFNPAGEGMPVIRIRDLKTGTPQNWTTEDHPKKTLIKTGDVVVGMDAEFRATIWPGENGYLNQRLFLARSKESSVNSFFVQHTLAPQLELEENTQVGTTVSHLGKKELDKFAVLNPGKELLFEYSKATTPLFERLVSNHVALKTLTKLRDTLLPKLTSGELRIPEAEQLTEEALA